MNLFDHLNNITYYKKELDFTDPEISKTYDSFMINKWLSMSDLNIPTVNTINKYNIPDEMHFKYMINILPQRKQFFNYVKRNEDLYKVKLKICEEYRCNMKEASDYILYMTEKEIQELMENS